MTKTFSMVSHKHYNLGANEGFVVFLTSKLIACYIDTFTSKRISQSTAYLLNGSEHIYWILDLENEMHSIWAIWTSRLQECKGQAKVRRPRLRLFWWCPCPSPWWVQHSSGVFRETGIWVGVAPRTNTKMKCNLKRLDHMLYLWKPF